VGALALSVWVIRGCRDVDLCMATLTDLTIVKKPNNFSTLKFYTYVRTLFTLLT